jgi:maleylpyruvate isomerase
MYHLRSYWRSTCSWRVRIVLNYKEIPHKIVLVHLIQDGGEQYQETHIRMNPEALVPVLTFDDIAIAQSVAICEYLEEQHPAPALLPADPLLRAKVRQLVEVINSTIQPLQNLRVNLRLKTQHHFDEKSVRQWNAHWIKKGLQAFESVVEDCGGRYCVGDEITLADVFLVPQLYNAMRFGVDIEAFRKLILIDDNLNMQRAFIKARPEVQVDSPENQL